MTVTCVRLRADGGPVSGSSPLHTLPSDAAEYFDPDETPSEEDEGEDEGEEGGDGEGDHGHYHGTDTALIVVTCFCDVL